MCHVLLGAQLKEPFLLQKSHMWLKNFMRWVALKSLLVTQLGLVHLVMFQSASYFHIQLTKFDWLTWLVITTIHLLLAFASIKLKIMLGCCNSRVMVPILHFYPTIKSYFIIWIVLTSYAVVTVWQVVLIIFQFPNESGSLKDK